MITNQHNSKILHVVDSQKKTGNLQELNDTNRSVPPVPLMSLMVRSNEYCHTSISTMTYSIPTALNLISETDNSLTSTFADRINISKFHFAQVIKVPHGTTLLASDNQSTTICINSNGNIIHLITPTGYHIRSVRWLETDAMIVDVFWCDVLQVYLAATCKSLYKLQCDAHQSLSIDKCLDFPPHDSSLKIFVTSNSYRLYIHHQSSNFIDVYTLQFAHLHSKQLPNRPPHHSIEAFSSTDSYVVCVSKQMTTKLIVLDPTSMLIVHEIDLFFDHILSLRCFDDDNTLVLIGVRQDGEHRLVFLSMKSENEANDMSPVLIEKAIDRDKQCICVLPRCRDLMMLNVIAARVQYVKYRC